jgi:hypothetical protein
MLQVGEENFGVQTAVGEHDGLQLAVKQFVRYPGAFVDVAPPDAEIPIDHRRVVENESLFASRSSVIFDDFNILFDEL